MKNKMGFSGISDQENPLKTTAETITGAERERLFAEYHNGLAEYDKLYLEVKKMIAEAEKIGTDEESKKLLAFTDKERDDLHKKLNGIAARLGKNEHDVMVDIFRQRGTLEEYGLPEFPVLKGGESVVMPGFNIDTTKLSVLPPQKPGGAFYKAQLEHEAELDEMIKQEAVAGEEFGSFAEENKKILNSMVIIYNITPIFDPAGNRIEQNQSGMALSKKDHLLRRNRQLAIMEKFGLDPYEEMDGNYHLGSSLFVNGVVVPSDRIAEIAAAIRDNPAEFRLGEQFYSDNEKKAAENDFKSYMDYLKKHFSEDEVRRYLAERKKLYGNE
jgi:hypothetical protein